MSFCIVNVSWNHCCTYLSCVTQPQLLSMIAIDEKLFSTDEIMKHTLTSIRAYEIVTLIALLHIDNWINSFFLALFFNIMRKDLWILTNELQINSPNSYLVRLVDKGSSKKRLISVSEMEPETEVSRLPAIKRIFAMEYIYQRQRTTLTLWTSFYDVLVLIKIKEIRR